MEFRLQSLKGHELHSEGDFLLELASRVMDRYESTNRVAQPIVLATAPIMTPTRTRSFYRRLFDRATGQHSPEFETVASEALAQWIEVSLCEALHAECGAPHNSEPAYDVLALCVDDSGKVRLRVVSVKATLNNLQNNGTKALRRLAELAKGDFDAELMARLVSMEERGLLPPQIEAGDLLYDVNRGYCVTLVHAEDRDAVKILTTYDTAIAGGPDRRLARLARVDWTTFWVELGKRVYEQLI